MDITPLKGRRNIMSSVGVITRIELTLICVFLAGCSLTFRVTSDVSEEDDRTITKQAFSERVCGEYVTLHWDNRQQKSGIVLSVERDCIVLIEERDTVDVQMQQIEQVHKKHGSVGAIVGLPVGTILGGLAGAVLLPALYPNERFAGLAGLVYGAPIGLFAGLIVGAANPPTTIYEFRSPDEIKAHPPVIPPHPPYPDKSK